MQPKWDLLMIAAMMSTLIVAALMGLSWLAGFIWRSVRSLVESRYQVAQAFPVQLLDEGAGEYRVEGVMRATEEEVVWLIEARTRANAIAKAEIRGAVVTRVVKLATAAETRQGTEPVAVESMEHQPVTPV